MTEAEDRISQRIDKSVTSVVPVTKSQAAGLSMETLAQVMEFAKLMAISDVAVPKYLRGNPGACLAIATQALEWRMSPFSVANKSYNVNDRIAYEAQLINAVVLSRAPIKGRFEVKYEGAGDHRVCIVSVQPKVGERIEHASPPREKITPKNSPLWKSDPDQQQFYYTSRALCRRYFPDVLLGVYADDELPTIDVMSEKVPRVEAPRDLSDRLDALVDDGADYSSGDEHASGGTGETIDQGGPLSSPGAEVSSHADATPSASDRPPGTQPQPPSEAP